MKFFSVLLKALFYLSFAVMAVGFGCHFANLKCFSIASYGAFLLIFSPALGFLYLTGYYLKEKNNKLAFLSFMVFLILFLNVLLQK